MNQIFIKVTTKKEARRFAPWAYKIVKVFDMWVAFQTKEDYMIWKKQK